MFGFGSSFDDGIRKLTLQFVLSYLCTYRVGI